MENSRTYLDPRTLARLSSLALRARHIVEGYVAGLHRSPYRGFSIEFAEHREYAPGDDLKHVDWRVFGRTDKVYLKQYEDETNLVCYLALDGSESMRYRGPAADLSKWEYAQCLVAALAWLVLAQQDAVGLVLFDSEIRSFLRPSGSSPQLKQVLHLLDQSPPGPETRLGPALHQLASRLSKRGVVLVISDFLDSADGILTGLARLKHHRHDLAVLHLLDPAELDFPFRRLTQFRGLEGQASVLADPAAVRRAYRAEIQKHIAAVRSGCTSRGIEYVSIRTDQPLDVALSAFLRARSARVQ